MSSRVFGPVPSRRLGRSLGVDLTPRKACTYDCLYCQLGRTTHRTIERKEWFPLEQIVAQVRERLPSRPDYVTLSGSGEPTLYGPIDELIARIKSLTGLPVAVLTNGSLLWQPDLRQQLRSADLVVPSLDAGCDAMFQAVNRPHEAIAFDRMVDGLVAFRQEFSGAFWLEVMVVGGYTATDWQIDALAACVDRIGPDRVQLNTVTRPGADERAAAVSADQLSQYGSRFRPSAEVIADFRGVHREPQFQASRAEVLTLLQRRPCSISDVASGLGLHEHEVVKHLECLLASGAIELVAVGGQPYYRGRATAATDAGRCGLAARPDRPSSPGS